MKTLEQVATDYGLTPDGVEFALEQYQKVICEITHSRMSKLSYYADDILSVANDVRCDGCEYTEPHIITKKDFENNPNIDENGYLPAYCEKIDRPIGWMAIHKGYIGARKDIRYWTGKPTAEQRKAVEWE